MSTRTTRVWTVTGSLDCSRMAKVFHHEDAYLGSNTERRLQSYPRYSAKSKNVEEVCHSVEAQSYPRRMDRRSILTDVGKNLYTVRSNADFAFALAEIVRGLECMYLAGFIHRAISPGNCLIYDDGQMKISDLEYVRQYVTQGLDSAPLSSTPGFMAVEYQVEKHLFKPAPVFKRAKPRPARKAPWFRFNFLHDLESVIWIYLWFLVETLPELLSPARRHHMLFNSSIHRLLFMQAFATDELSCYDEVISALMKVFGVDSNLTKAVESFASLADYYREVESSEPVLPENPQTTHWDPRVFLPEYYRGIHVFFMDAHEQMKDKTLPIWYTDEKAKHRAQQTAKHRSAQGPNKRGPAYVVFEEEADSDLAAPPSPTEESQNRNVVAGKRKRGGRS